MKVVIVFIQINQNGVTTEKLIHEVKKPKEVFLLSDIQEKCKKNMHLSFVFDTVSFITYDITDFRTLINYLTEEQSLYDTSIERIEQKHGKI